MPRMIELIRSSAVPASLVQSAARGGLSLPPEETIEILVHLAKHNKVFGEQARMTLAGWDEKACQAAAANPSTSKEVLEYWIASENLRPVLVPYLLENPGVPESTLAQLAVSGSREMVEWMLKSVRVNSSAEILKALLANPNLRDAESTSFQKQLASMQGGFASTTAAPDEDVLFGGKDREVPQADDVLDPEVTAFLAEHEQEFAAEADKPFQPIGGFYEELMPGSDEPLSEAPVVAAQEAAKPEAAVSTEHRTVTAKKTALSHDEERGSALQKISRLDVKGRIQLAMKGNKEERSILVRDGTKLVALAVLESPKISDGEVEKIALQKNVLEAVLRFIPMKRRFVKNYVVIRNLVSNPRTPLDVSLGLMKHLLVTDLRHLSANKEVSETVRKLAFKMFRQKTDTTKKSTD
jgi:hypothetical protein